MSEEEWFKQITLTAGFAPFYWQWPHLERWGNQFVFRFGPFYVGWSWIEPKAKENATP